MKLDLFNIEDFVRLNRCKEVTSPVMFQANKMPNPDGLLSYDIFGYSENERKNIFAYIDLHDYYIHPIIYAMLSARMGSVKYIISGAKKCIINNGRLVIVPEGTANSGTGLKFIYDNFEKIKWIDELEENEISSLDKKTRLKFLQSLKKEEFFIRKWLVLPAHYREESSDSTSMGDVINQLYKELIGACRSLKSGFSFELFGNNTKMRIQELLLSIYQSTMTPISGKSVDPKTREVKGVSKNSLLLRHVMGKTLDYGAYTIMVAPIASDAKTVKSFPVPFGTAKIPLHSCVALFNPFFVHEASILIDSMTSALNLSIKNELGRDKYVDVSDYSAGKIEKIIARFIKSEYERFDPIIFNIKSSTDSSFRAEFYFEMTEYETEEDAKNQKNGFNRAFTYTDLIYQSALKVLVNKHGLITRHPVTNNKNIYPALIKPLSTARTRTIYTTNLNPDLFKGDIVKFEEYPYIKGQGKEMPKPYYDFIGTSILGNAVLAAIAGDYDGDMTFIRGLYSLEANEEAHKIIMSKSNLLDSAGSPIRGLKEIGNDVVVSLYELTKD